jgi:hypothetical protein
MPDGEDENWTCDGCGEVKPGDVSLSLVQTETTLFYFGLCPPCADQYRQDINAFQETGGGV